MSSNGISTLSSKQARQVAKLNLAQAKRQGRIVSNTGVVTGSANSAQAFYRTRNSYDLNNLPTKFSGNTIVDNPNAGGLILGRPWS